MAEITQEGYQNIRAHIEDDWIWIELRDDVGDPVLRISTADERVEWIHDPGAEVLELRIVVTGGDAEITVPQTFAYSAIYNVETGGDAFSVEQFAQFTIETEADELTVIHQIEVPEQEE